MIDWIKFNKPNTRIKWLILFSGLALGLFFSMAFTMKATSNANFCASCHQIKPVVSAWESGPHQEVDCISCHADPGKAGYIKRKIGGLKEVYLQATGSFNPKDLNPKINLNNCINCHTKGNEKHPTAIIISSFHTSILENKVSCLGCHLEAGHGDFSKGKRVEVK